MSHSQLDEVAKYMRDAQRVIVQSHPNRFEASLHRRVESETIEERSNEHFGIGVLDPIVDVEDVDYWSMGDCDVLYVKYPSDDFAIVRGMTVDDLEVGQYVVLMEMREEDGVPENEPTAHDIIMVRHPKYAADLALEIVDIVSDVRVGGGTRRYVCEPRDDLNYLHSV